jgi:hypothetical protein
MMNVMDLMYSVSTVVNNNNKAIVLLDILINNLGSDICTCRPYLIYGIEECVKQAQEGGVGVIVYCKFIHIVYILKQTKLTILYV